jgi:hypothetical protein
VSSTVFYESASELATLTNTFLVGGVATDPTEVTLVVTAPSGAATPYAFSLAEIENTAVGVYAKDIACTEDGEWQAVWTGTGAAQDVQTVTWTVWETSLGKLYATVAALKSRLGNITTTASDTELHGACFAASRWVEQYCQRVFYRSAAATVRTFEPTHSYRLKMPQFNDLVSVSALKTDAGGDGTFETTWTAADYQLLPYNPAAGPETQPYTEIRAVGALNFPRPPTFAARRDTAQVTGVFGWSSVPQAVREATLIKAAELFKLKDAPFGVAGSEDIGFIRIRDNLPVQSQLGPYRRHPWLAA